MFHPEIIKPALIAGAMLCIMSIVDTLAYGMRTAGVLTKRLAISLALFNILVIISRLSNVMQAPILGNFPDKVDQGTYQISHVLAALRLDLLFVVVGVVIGALLTPTFIKVTSRGIMVMEQKGSLPPTLLHGMRRAWRFPSYATVPSLTKTAQYLDFRKVPLSFLVFNILVTAFYSIGVMSTVLAASMDHSVAGTAIMLSGIVNGLATMLLFIIVDPPAAVVVDQCINGKRPEEHAKVMNVYLVLTRLCGCILGIIILPLMAHYVLAVAHWVNAAF